MYVSMSVMAYKTPENIRSNWRKWYERNRESFIKRNKIYNQTQAGKESSARRSKRAMEKNPTKWKARQTLRNAVHARKIVKGSCEECDEVKVEGHHEDYNKPLEVNWLCSKHHQKIHE